jgi:hypothetical protein
MAHCSRLSMNLPANRQASGRVRQGCWPALVAPSTSPPVSDVSCSIENRRFAASIAANRTDPAHRLFALGNAGSMIKCCTTTVFSDFGPDAQDTVKYSARAGLKLP